MIQQQHNSEIWHCLIQAYAGGVLLKQNKRVIIPLEWV